MGRHEWSSEIIVVNITPYNKKNQASTGFQPMTSMILSQRYYSKDDGLESGPSLNFLQVLFSQLDYLIKLCT